MRKLLLSAMLLLTVCSGIRTAVAAETHSSGDQDSYGQTISLEVNAYKKAQAIAAPGACEKSTAEFVRIGEYGEHADKRSAGDFYGTVLAAEVERSQSVWATVAPRMKPDTHDAHFAAPMPQSMAYNAEASATGDFYSQTIAAQFSLNRLIEAVNRF